MTTSCAKLSENIIVAVCGSEEVVIYKPNINRHLYHNVHLKIKYIDAISIYFNLCISEYIEAARNESNGQAFSADASYLRPFYTL